MKKMKGKVIALFATLAFILVFVSSINVVTLFQGSHQITDISLSGNDINCTGCHQWVRNELNNSIYHKWMECEDCHRYEGTGIVFAKNNQVGNQAHAAYTPRCLDCHNGSGVWIEGKFATPARAFNLSDYGTDYSAHKQFVKQSSSDFDMSVGENEACIACHTNYSIEIEYSYFWDISYELSSWSFGTSFTPNGTRYNTSSKNESGAKHEFVNTSDINCISCHKNIYDALVYGTDGDPDDSSYDYHTHSPIEVERSGGGGKDHDWRTINYWGSDPRYHYRSSPRATKVDTTYCKQCHFYTNGTLYGDIATNRSDVHCVEKVSCLTCHGPGKTKDPYSYLNGSSQRKGDPPTSDSIRYGHSDLMNETATKALTFHGDMCMGCHEAAGHTEDSLSQCSHCHGSGGGEGDYGDCGKCHYESGGNVNINIESEPSGKVTRS